jgi:hypothetical protein
VIDLGSPESRIGFTILPHPEFGLLNSYRTLALRCAEKSGGLVALAVWRTYALINP